MKLMIIAFLFYIIITSFFNEASAQQRTIKGECYIENKPDSYVLVKVGKQSSINQENRFLFTDSVSYSEILFNSLETVPLKIKNIPSKIKNIDFGKIELISFSDKRISKEDYTEERNSLLKVKNDTSFVDALLKNKYRNVVTVQTYTTYRKEYLNSLSEKEKEELMKRKENNDRQPDIGQYYFSRKPSKNIMSIYITNNKKIEIPIKKHIKKDTIYLDYGKVYREFR